ncbi:hypothetical protein BDZ97DRAFT_1855616 [Flammula alnicola]|nr:hypothetical protein BDZ97DRAFT_1855616 [Flammula alnicola]
MNPARMSFGQGQCLSLEVLVGTLSTVPPLRHTLHEKWELRNLGFAAYYDRRCNSSHLPSYLLLGGRESERFNQEQEYDF